MTDFPPGADLDRVAPLWKTLHQLDEAHRRFRNYVADSLALSPTELTALVVIAVTPGISPSGLARDLSVTHGAVTALIETSRTLVSRIGCQIRSGSRCWSWR